MGWDQQSLLIVYGIGVFLVILLLIWKSPKKKASLLKFTGNKKLQKMNLSGVFAGEYQGVDAEAEKSVNVIFMFNGHSFDAYEVLGLPAGSSWDKVEDAYKRVMNNADPSEHEFMGMAFSAIKQSLKA